MINQGNSNFANLSEMSGRKVTASGLNSLYEELDFVKRISKLADKEFQAVSQECVYLSKRKGYAHTSYDRLQLEFVRLVRKYLEEAKKLIGIDLEIEAGRGYKAIHEGLEVKKGMLAEEHFQIQEKSKMLADTILELKATKKLDKAKVSITERKGGWFSESKHASCKEKRGNVFVQKRSSDVTEDNKESLVQKVEMNELQEEQERQTLFGSKVRSESCPNASYCMSQLPSQVIESDKGCMNQVKGKFIDVLKLEIVLNKAHVRLLTKLIDNINSQIHDFPSNAKERSKMYPMLKAKLEQLKKDRKNQRCTKKAFLDQVEIVRSTIMKCQFLENDVKELEEMITNGKIKVQLQEKKVFNLRIKILGLELARHGEKLEMVMSRPAIPFTFHHESYLIAGDEDLGCQKGHVSCLPPPIDEIYNDSAVLLAVPQVPRPACPALDSEGQPISTFEALKSVLNPEARRKLEARVH